MDALEKILKLIFSCSEVKLITATGFITSLAVLTLAIGILA